MPAGAGWRIRRRQAVCDDGAAPVATGEPLAVDRVVIRASRDLAASLDDRLNICPVKGYSITVSRRL